MNNYDVGIIGAGVSGVFAALKIARDHKNIKTILFDLGRPPAKRRRQLEGFLGCLPNSDGKLYLNDLVQVAKVAGTRRTKSADNWVQDNLSDITDLKVIKDKPIATSLEKRIKKNGFNVVLNDYMQMYPKDIHSFSKSLSNVFEKSKNVTLSFDNEVYKVTKQKNHFSITTSTGEIICKNIIVCVGRSGWRWVSNLYSDFGIIENNDIARFGIKVEMPSSVMKDFNKSNCSIIKEDLEIGPLCWYGTVIPEDHLDLAICAFRSNENRWKSDKVSFNLIANRTFKNNGFEQTDRIGKLTFVLANDRIIKEKISLIMSNRSKISIIPEYDWLVSTIPSIDSIIPDILTRGYFHAPTIVPLPPKINMKSDFATEIKGMYCAGEAAGIHGILGAAISGTIAGDNVCK